MFIISHTYCSLYPGHNPFSLPIPSLPSYIYNIYCYSLRFPLHPPSVFFVFYPLSKTPLSSSSEEVLFVIWATQNHSLQAYVLIAFTNHMPNSNWNNFQSFLSSPMKVSSIHFVQKSSITRLPNHDFAFPL